MPIHFTSQLRFAMLSCAVLALLCGLEWFPLPFEARPVPEVIAGMWFLVMVSCVALLMFRPVDSIHPILGGMLGFMISFPLTAFVLCGFVLLRRLIEGDGVGFALSIACAAAAALLPLVIEGVRAYLHETDELTPKLVAWGILAAALTGFFRFTLYAVIPALSNLAQAVQENDLVGPVTWTLALLTVLYWDRSERYLPDDLASPQSVLSSLSMGLGSAPTLPPLPPPPVVVPAPSPADLTPPPDRPTPRGIRTTEETFTGPLDETPAGAAGERISPFSP